MARIACGVGCAQRCRGHRRFVETWPGPRHTSHAPPGPRRVGVPVDVDGAMDESVDVLQVVASSGTLAVHVASQTKKYEHTTVPGFEPGGDRPIGVRDQLLSHSVKQSGWGGNPHAANRRCVDPHPSSAESNSANKLLVVIGPRRRCSSPRVRNSTVGNRVMLCCVSCSRTISTSLASVSRHSMRRPR